MQEDAFDGADYYDCQDAEELMHESASEAIADLLDCWVTPPCDTPAVIQEHSPITVTAYRHVEISEAEFATRALHAAQSILEALDEEYGDPDGHHVLRQIEESLGAALAPALRAWCQEHYQPWMCNPSGKRVYDADAVEALMRKDKPEWFEATTESKEQNP
jgi:hypothetical protein